MPLPSKIVGSLPSMVPFVGPEALERRLGRKFDLRLGANESPFGPSPVAIEAMRRQAGLAQNYGDPEGWDLRSALAELHQVRIEEIVLAAGIDDLLALFCRAYGDSGSILVTTLGSYPTLEYGALGAGLDIRRVSYKDDAIDLDALVAEANACQASIVYLANPDNPSGAWKKWEEVQLLRKALPTDTLLLLDEAYIDFAPPGTTGSIDTTDPGIVHLRTFSKAHGMAGMRVGYAVGHAETVGLLNRIRMHFGISCVALAGALASLGDPGHIAHVVSETAKGKARLTEEAAKLGLGSIPSATNFLLLDAGSKPRADSLLARLLELGVFVRKPGLPPLDRCVRITIGTATQMDQLAGCLVEAVRSL